MAPSVAGSPWPCSLPAPTCHNGCRGEGSAGRGSGWGGYRRAAACHRVGTQQARPPQDLCMCCASVFFSRSSQNSALGISLHSSLPGLPALLREHPVHFMVFHIDTDAGLLMGLPEDRHQMPLDGPQPPGPSLLSTSCQLTLRHAGWIVTLRCPLTSLTPTPWEQTDPLATWRTPQRLPSSGVQGLRAHRPGAQPLVHPDRPADLDGHVFCPSLSFPTCNTGNLS
ncbi:uncharacterized protein [Marmota flaviventris]|uniref:uncharacterized protein isoform X2 n=1 Tax=Marmota flaviventris TaxID=93162 RepID=UPI003A856FB5